MAAVCQTCGVTGYRELLLCCSKCQISVEHRYCLDKIPRIDDKEFAYTCQQCVISSVEKSSPQKTCLYSLRSRPSQRTKQRRPIFDRPTTYVQYLKKEQDNINGLAAESESELELERELEIQLEMAMENQMCALAPPLQTSKTLLKDVPPEEDLGENNRTLHCCDVNSDADQELKRQRRRLIPDDLDRSDGETEYVEGQQLHVSTDAIGGSIEFPSHHSSLEDQTCGGTPSLQTSKTLLKDVPPEEDLSENNRSLHCCDVNSDGDQECKRQRRRLILEDLEKSDEETEYVEGQHLQGSTDAIGGPIEFPLHHSSLEYPNYVHAQPIINPSWWGCFDVRNVKYGTFVAHLSSKACLKVYEGAKLMPMPLSVEIMPRLDAWPKSFCSSRPTDESVALYFFPGNESAEKAFDRLVIDIIDGDLALKAFIDNNVELLIFSSCQLPQQYWRFNGKYYLWGVFRGKDPVTSKSAGSHHIGNRRTECVMSISVVGSKEKRDSAESLRMSPLSPLSISSYWSESPNSPLHLNKGEKVRGVKNV